MNNENKNKQAANDKQSVLTKETLGVVIALFSTLCLICLITREKIFALPGQAINAFFLGILGWFSYPAIICTGIFGVMLLLDKKVSLKGKTKAYVVLSVVCVALFCQVLSMGETSGYDGYGDYLSESYFMGADGIGGSSAGGILFALLAYPLSALMTVVGSAVLAGVGFAYCAYSLLKIAYEKGNENQKAKNRSFRSSYVAQNQNNDGGIKISGERDYPVEGVVLPSEKPAQRLFVNNADDFAFKTKKEVAKNESERIKLEIDKNGMGIANYGGSYSENYTQEMKDKIEYIKTPAKIVFDNKFDNLSQSQNQSGTTVSGYLNRTTDNGVQNGRLSASAPKEDNLQNTDDKSFGEKTPSDIPHYEHTINRENKIDVDSADLRAKKFGDYANNEEFGERVNVKEAEETYIPISGERANKVSGFAENAEQEKSVFVSDEQQEQNEEVLPPVVEEEVQPSRIDKERTRSILFGERKRDYSDEVNRTSERETSGIEEAFTSNVERDGNLRAQRKVYSPDNDYAETESRTENTVQASEEEPKKEKVVPPINREYHRPPLDLLETYTVPPDAKQENHEERIQRITGMLEDFHISVEPLGYIQGPSITRYELKMPAGISVKKVLAYDDDLKMCLLTKDDVRIEAPIPGKNAVGVEVANEHKVTVGLKEVLEGAAGKKAKPGSLIFALGKDLVGNAITDDLAECKHFLVAGSTGSGKSVCMNVMLVSLIMRYSPEELRLILIDPKGVEFKPYEHIPHLMIDEIIAEPKKALAVFHWAYEEMERRYKMFQEHEGVVDINGYNEVVASDTVPKMPRIAIFVDELSNLMETCKKEMDARILSIAQKARAAGIHLVLATQRPSVDVITGTIKANLPSRIALKLMTFADSNTIISEGGAEKLLGNGDMLYRNSGMSTCARYQGAFLSRREVNNIVKYIKENNAAYFDEEMQEYLDKSVRPKEEERAETSGESADTGDRENNDLFKRALWLAVSSGTVAISQLQRRFQIGYARAGGLVDKMERMGFISGNEGSKARRVNLTVEEFEEKFGPIDDSI